MPPLDHLLAFALASLLLIIIPGPSVLFVVGRSLALGRRGGLLSVVGNELGGIPLVVAVAIGVGTVVEQSVLLFTVIKLAGAAYLAFLGVQAIRHRGATPATETAPDASTSTWTPLREGFVVGVTNPKTIVFFVAALPQFVDPDGAPVAAQMTVLGLLFLLIALVCDGVWAVAAGTARSWFASSPRRLARIRGAGGGLMIGLAGVLALEK